MKKAICCMLIMALCTGLLSGCGKKETRSDKAEKTLSEFEELLIRHEWKYFDFDIMENEIFSCTKEGEFYYLCDCGEPIDDYDFFDRYEYDAQTQTIRLLGEKMERSVKILSFDESHLLTDMEGEIKDFYSDEYEFSIPSVPEDYKEETEVYTGYKSVVDMSEDKVVLNTPNYDRMDVKIHRFDEVYALASEVTIRHLQITNQVIKEQQTVEEEQPAYEAQEMSQEEKEPICEVQEITKEEAVLLAKNAAHAFVWINQEKKVEQILFYSEQNISV